MAGDGSGKKATVEMIEQRCSVIKKLIIRGVRERRDIHQYIYKMDSLSPKEQQKQGWEPFDVNPRQIDQYMIKVRAEMKQEAQRDIEEFRGELIDDQFNIFYECMRERRYQTAVSALREIARLRGLDQLVVKHSGKFDINSEVELTDEEKAEIMERFEQFMPDMIKNWRPKEAGEPEEDDNG